MVDCGNPRCAQERRFFKKELLSWSKKVPLMIAYEQIAANYSDKENSKQLANPYTSLETEEEKEDWEADDSCFYCEGPLNNSLDHLEDVLQEAKHGRLDADSSCKLLQYRPQSPPCLTIPPQSPPCLTIPPQSPPCLTTPPQSPPCLTTPPQSPPCLTIPPQSPPCLTIPPQSPPCLTIPPQSPPCLTIPPESPMSYYTTTEFPMSYYTTTESPMSYCTTTEYPMSYYSTTESPMSYYTTTESPMSYYTTTESPMSYYTTTESPMSYYTTTESPMSYYTTTESPMSYYTTTESPMSYYTTTESPMSYYTTTESPMSYYTTTESPMSYYTTTESPMSYYTTRSLCFWIQETSTTNQPTFINIRFHLSTDVRSLQDLLPFHIKYYTHGLGRELLAELGSKSSYTSNAAVAAPAVQVSTSTTTTSNNHCHHITADIDDADHVGHSAHKALAIELKIPQLRGRSRKGEHQTPTGTKRGYTEEDLEAAVADIRGGKLGTRRASSLYGIPRSTLRNKIFRSGSDMDRVPAFLDPEESNSGDEMMAAVVTRGMKMAELMQAGVFPYMSPLTFSHASMIKEEPELSRAAMCDEFALRLEHIRRMHNLNGDPEQQIKPAHISDLKLPLLTALIRRLVEQRFRMELGKGQSHAESERMEVEMGSSQGSSPALGDRKSMAISVDTLPHFLPYLPSFSPSCLALPVPSSFEDLRIPSYKPANDHHRQQHREDQDAIMEEDLRPFGKVYETSRIGETLKDIIVKSISEKMRFHEMDTPPLFSSAGDLFGQSYPLVDPFPLDLGKSAFRSCRPEISQPTHPAKRIKREPCDDQEVQSSKNGSEGSKSRFSDYRKHKEGRSISGHSARGSSKSHGDVSGKEKKTRPKRGQYRKYNSQLLIEAVRAVQRGEMSVHRAGSYFGVPHSTLEYKVKERHLLRQKKPREGGGSSSGTATTTAATTTTSEPNSPPSTTSTTSSTSATQTSKMSLVASSISSDSFSSSPSSSSLPPQAGAGSSSSKTESSQTPLPLPSSPSSISALGFGLHKQAGGGSDFPWFQPYLMSGASPSPFDPALSLFPQGFALNTSASELLRKLQHKVQSKSPPSSPFSAESSFNFAHPNGSSSLRESFLLYN
ncbi:uncharacterized protein [Littorina saxatilis]|uniref:uncharacterized protein n=1 Tax=Littorina saxatilis TaxID=31220 RepID=UPI0038B6111F